MSRTIRIITAHCIFDDLNEDKSRLNTETPERKSSAREFVLTRGRAYIGATWGCL